MFLKFSNLPTLLNLSNFLLLLLLLLILLLYPPYSLSFFYPSPLFAPLRLIIFMGTKNRTREYKGY